MANPIVPTQGIPWVDQFVQTNDPAFYTNPSVWDVAYWGPSRALVPGLSAIKWKKHPHRVVDKAHKPATDGVNPKLLGYAFAEFDMEIVLFSSAQWQSFQQMVKQLFPGKSPPLVYGGSGQFVGPWGLDLTNGTSATDSTAFVKSLQSQDGHWQLIHPELLAGGVTNVVFESYTPPMKHGDAPDIRMAVLHGFEYKKSRDVKAQQVVKAPGTNSHLVPPTKAGTDPSAAESGPALQSLKKNTGTGF